MKLITRRVLPLDNVVQAKKEERKTKAQTQITLDSPLSSHHFFPPLCDPLRTNNVISHNKLG